MGIENRDYTRGTPSGGYGYSGAGPGGKSAVVLLLIANIVVYVLQTATFDFRGPEVSEGITGWLNLSLADLQRGQVWRLVTYGFCHDPLGIGHIFWNMVSLWIFGRLIEPIYGWKEFLAMYLVGVVLSGLGHVAFQAFTGSTAGVVGASGGVMSVVMVCAMIFPYHKILMFLLIPVEFRVMAVLYIIVDLIGLTHGGDGVANAAHLAGAAWGLAYKYYDLRVLGGWWQRLTERTRQPKRNPNVRLHQPEEPVSPPPPPAKTVPPISLDEEVDMILEKIYVQGESSLTDREREILKQASHRYRKK